MKNLMFVHGAEANENSWFDIPKPFIDEKENGAKKYRVVTVQLKGHDRPLDAEPDFRTSMSDYMKSMKDAMGGHRDWILIGHSMGGMVISQFAADFPDLVEKLIYVTAILPRAGETVSTLLGITDEKAFLDFRKRVKDEFDKHTDPRISAARASQPISPLNEPFRETPGFVSKSRYYIYCEDDGVIRPDQQKEMVSKANGGVMKTTTDSIFSDHIVQLSEPRHLVMSITKGIYSN